VELILALCAGIADPLERLQACGQALKKRLADDGYLNTRVTLRAEPVPGVIEVEEGRIAAVKVEGSNSRLNRRLARLLRPLQGRVLHLPSLASDLQLLRRQPGVGGMKASLASQDGDPTRAVFVITAVPGPRPWEGDVSLRNDGSNGSGEVRAVAVLSKPDLAIAGDILLLYGELDGSREAELGSLITSISYTYPLTDTFNLTGAFGFSRNNLVELKPPADGISTSQYQGLVQLEWVFRETLRERWSLFAGYSGNRINRYLNDTVLPDRFASSVRSPSSGYLRMGISGSRLGERAGWSGTAYLLQGIAAATPEDQRSELAQADIEPGRATAIGGLLTAAWGFAPNWQLNARLGGQWAFRPLTAPMRFTLGSDAGLIGLPGQLVDGDSGWLSTVELAWTFWRSPRNASHALQLVPFIGVGGVRTSLPEVTFNDTVGAGGLMLRWLAGEQWRVDLGWVEQFETNDNVGVWNDWLLGSGLYAKLQYRF
jgi:hemolysin activation/secretion protein